MRKMKTLFEQEQVGNRLFVIDKLRPENEFILTGEYDVYHKRDGTAVMIQDNVMYKRYDANLQKGRTIPENAIPCQDEAGITGSFPVWVKTDRNNPSDRWHYEAFDTQDAWENGTYELCGEKINGNREKITGHTLINHNSEKIENVELTYQGIKNYFENNYIEGFVIKCRKTGLMTKIRRKDYGLEWR